MQTQHFTRPQQWYSRSLVLLLTLLCALGLTEAAQAQTVTPGYVRGWGWNHVGQLDIPPDLSDVIAVSASQIHSLALKSNGTVVAWGFDVTGSVTVPSGLNSVIAISAGANHSLALKSNGSVVAWGCGAGQDFGQCTVPSTALSGVIAIAAGDHHSLALKSNGSVIAWGCGGGYDYNQCTIPAAATSGVTAIAAGGIHSLALKSNGAVVPWGDISWTPSGLSGVVAIAAGGSSAHNLALKSNGTVVAWGDNQWGQTDVPAGLNNVVAIATGYGHSVAVKSDGTVVAWSDNYAGRIDVPAGLTGVTAIAASWHNLVIVPPPSVTINQATGQADPTTTLPVLFTATFSRAVTDFTAADVTLSGTANLANATITISGGPSVYTISVDGVAGSGTVIATIAANVAVDAVGIGNRASTSTDNSVTLNQSSDPPAITPNVVGTLGNNNWYVSNVTVSWTVAANGAAISSQSGCETQTVTSDTSSVTFTCTATSVNGGSSSESVTLKRDATAPTISAAATTAPNAAGWYNQDVTVHFTCSDALAGVVSCPADQVLSSEGAAVAATAQSATDQAGNTSAASNVITVKIDKTAPVVTVTGVTNGATYPVGGVPAPGCTASDALAGVATQATVLVSGGNAVGTGLFIVTCRGATDNAGNLGSSSVNYLIPVAPNIVIGWGNTSAPADLGSVMAVDSGANHSLALKLDGTVVAWGSNYAGQAVVPAGVSDVIAIAAGISHNLALKRDGTVVAWGSNSAGQSSVPANLSGVIAIAAGWQNSLALKSDGTIVGWGLNNYGQSSAPAGLRDVIAIGTGYENSAALKSDGTVVSWGRVGSNGLPVVPPADLANVIAIATGDYHHLALKSNGTVVAWGANNNGQRNVPSGLNNVVAIAAGGDVSLALKNDGTVTAWGSNYQGERNVPSGLDHVIAIAAGSFNGQAVKEIITVTVNQAAGQADPTSSNPVQFDLLFSEPVIGFTASDVTLSGSANRTGATITISGGPAAYTISVGGLSGNGTVIATIAANVVASANGKTNLASTSTDNVVTANFDSTPPVITPHITGDTGANGWYTGDVNVTWSVVDNESTIDNQSGCAAQSVTSDTAGVTFTCAATSVGGSNSQSVTIKRDATLPIITFVDRTAANSNGWNKGDVTVNWSCSDATAGAVAASASQTVSSEGANQTATGACTDNAGNSASDTQSGIKIDKTAPTISAAATTNPNGAGWYNSEVTVHFTCVDPLSGVTSCPADQLLSSEGSAVASTAQTVTDLAGNSSSASNVVTVKLDKTAPTISAAATTQPNANGWYTSDVTVHFTCADTLSGVTSCPADEILSNEGSAVASTAQSITDLAGNNSASNVVTVKLDKTAPVVTVTGVSAGASYPLGNVPTAGCSTTDAVAGVATQATLSVSGGSQGVGNFTATCSPATDQAGNASTAVSAAYTVVYGENSFVVLTQEGVAIAQNVTINSGSVGARLAGTGSFLANNAEVSFAQNSQMLDAASYLLGNRLVIQQNARVANVSYNSWSNAGTVRGVAVTPLNLALLPTLPPLPTITPGTQNLSVGQNGTLTLTPGSYGSLTVAQNATVTFVGGLYHFTGWTVAQNAKLYFQAASDIRIAGRLNSAQNVFIGPATTAPTLSAREIVLTVAGQNGTTGTLNATPKAVVFGQNSRLHLNLLAPNGTVQVEENSQATGAIFARWATFGQAVRLTLASRFGATGVTATAALTPTAESAELAPAPVTSEESPSTVTFDHLLYLPVVTR